MRLVVRLLRTLARETAKAAVADHTFLSATNTAGPLHELHAAEEGFRLGLELLALQHPQQEHGGLLNYLEQLVPMISALPVGGEVRRDAL